MRLPIHLVLYVLGIMLGLGSAQASSSVAEFRTALDSGFVERRAADAGIPLAARELQRSVLHNYPHKAAEAGGASAYLSRSRHPSLLSVAGFQSELNSMSYLNRTHDGPGRFTLAPRNHQVVDHLYVVNGQARGYAQDYAGSDLAKATEKWLGSDSAAPKLRLPRDVYDSLGRRLNDAIAVWSDAELDPQIRQAQVNRRLGRTGLVVSVDGVVSYRGQQIGALDGPELAALRGKLLRNPRTSDQLLARTMYAKSSLTSSTLRDFYARLSPDEKKSFTAMAKNLHESRMQYFENTERGRRLSAEAAYRSAEKTIERSLSKARELNLDPHETLQALKKVKPSGSEAVSARKQNRVNFNQLESTAQLKAQRFKLHRAGSRAVATAGYGFVLAVGMREWIQSGKPFDEWIASEAGVDWLVSSGIGVGADVGVTVASRMIEKLPRLAGQLGKFGAVLPLAFVASAVIVDCAFGGRPLLDSFAAHSFDAVCAAIITVGCLMGPTGWAVSLAVVSLQIGIEVYGWICDSSDEIESAKFDKLADWLRDTELSRWALELNSSYSLR